MNTLKTAIIAAVLVGSVLLGMFTASQYQESRRATLNLPTPINPIIGNEIAKELIVQWYLGDKITRERAGKNLCDIAERMFWTEIDLVFATFLKEEDCIPTARP